MIAVGCCCVVADTDPSTNAEEQSGAFLCLLGSPITTFYDKTPEFCRFARSVFATFYFSLFLAPTGAQDVMMSLVRASPYSKEH